MTQIIEDADKIYYLHMHIKPINFMNLTTPFVTVTAKVSVKGNRAVLAFGFSRLKSGDTFSKKYGIELTKKRADEDPTLLIGIKDFKPEYFTDIAKKMGTEVSFFSSLGQTLLSDVKLPEKTKKTYTPEEIEELRKKGLEQKAAKKLAKSEVTTQEVPTSGAAVE